MRTCSVVIDFFNKSEHHLALTRSRMIIASHNISKKKHIGSVTGIKLGNFAKLGCYSNVDIKSNVEIHGS